MSLRLSVLSLALCSLFACTVPAVSPPQETTATVGKAGGSLSLPSGAKLTIPAGALASDVTIGIKTDKPPEIQALGAAPVGKAFILSPEGQQFLAPVLLEVPYDPTLVPVGFDETSLRIRISPQSAPAYVDLDTTVDTSAHLLRGSTTHFSVVVASAGGAAGGCTSLTAGGAVVAQSREARTAPSATGGNLVSGTYHRIGDVIFTGSGGSTGLTGKSRKETLKMTVTSPTTATVESVVERTPGQLDRATLSVTASGTTLNLAESCPGHNTLSLSYTFSGNTFTVFEPDTSGTHMSIFALDDGSIPDGGSTSGGNDAGMDAGTPTTPTFETLATGLTDLVDLDVSASSVYVLGNGEVRRCALTGCGTSSTLVTAAYASSLAVNQDTLYVANNYRYISSCSLSAGSCSLTQVTDVGASSYPAHLWVANDRLYWISESGSSRRIQVCPLTGCSSGYPKFLYQGTVLDGLPISGLTVDATHAYVSSYTGGIFRITLTDAETANAATASQISPSGYGTGGLDLQGATLRWANVKDGILQTCTVPDCASVTQVAGGLASPAGVRTDATHVYGINRGAANGAGGFVAGSATIWRYAR